MSLFDIATLENQLQELENETVKEEFWQKSPNETGKILAQIKQLKGKVEQYNKINQEKVRKEEVKQLRLQRRLEKSKKHRV